MGLISYLKNFGASGKYGAIAFREYSQGNYAHAAELFEKIIGMKLRSTNERYIYVYLGRCYLAMGKVEDAEKVLSKSHDLYKGEQSKPLNEIDKKNFNEMIESYALALGRLGKHEEARGLLAHK